MTDADLMEFAPQDDKDLVAQLDADLGDGPEEDLLAVPDLEEEVAGVVASLDQPDLLDAATVAVFEASHAAMGFEMKKFVLQNLLEKAATVLPVKDIQPVLKNFQIEATLDADGQGRLRVIATDLELSVISTTEIVTVTKPGTAVFPGRKFADLVREAADDLAQIEVSDGTARITIGPTAWDLKLADGTEYPYMPDLAAVEMHSVNRVQFLGGISACRYAAAVGSVRPNLMMIEVRNGKMTACDGVRFQQVDLLGATRHTGATYPVDLNLPIGAVDDLVKLLHTTDATMVGIGTTDNHIIFRIGSDVFVANKLLLKFPDMEEILLAPALKNNERLQVDRQEFVDAVRRVRITADAETSAIVLVLADGTLTVLAKDKYGNQSSEVLTAGWDGADRQLVVNHRYLSDLLNMADAKSCQFWLGPDTKSRKSNVVLRDSETYMIGVINQMRKDWVA